MSLSALLLDNPILVKHARSRLRRQQLLPAIAGVVVIAALITWGAVAADIVRNGAGFWMILTLQIAILFLGGTVQVASSVAYSRDSGILDFHRISPVRPLALTLGFLLGGPIREYVLYACTLPFALVFVGMGSPSPLGFLMVLADTLVLALLFHSAALLAGLVAARSRGVGGGIVALILVLHMASGVPPLGLFTLTPLCQQAITGRSDIPIPTFFGLPVPPFPLSLLHQLPVLFFLLAAAVRKMRHERAFLFSKPVAVLFHLVLAFLLLSDVTNIPDSQHALPVAFGPLAVVYGLTAAALLLAAAVTPKFGDFANGIRRARKGGAARPPAWSDLASNWAPLLLFCVILLGTTVAASTLSVTQNASLGGVLPAALVGMGVIVYFGCARQGFDLMYRKNSPPYFVLFLFLLWIVPLFVALIASMSHMGDAAQEAILGASPIAGIALAATRGHGGWFSPGGSVALGSSVVMAVAFFQFRLRAERRAAEAALRGRD
jgi:hypothetical protein